MTDHVHAEKKIGGTVMRGPRKGENFVVPTGLCKICGKPMQESLAQPRNP